MPSTKALQRSRGSDHQGSRPATRVVRCFSWIIMRASAFEGARLHRLLKNSVIPLQCFANRLFSRAIRALDVTQQTLAPMPAAALRRLRSGIKAAPVRPRLQHRPIPGEVFVAQQPERFSRPRTAIKNWLAISPAMALVAVMRKLLHAAFGLFKHDALFDAGRLFPATAAVAGAAG